MKQHSTVTIGNDVYKTYLNAEGKERIMSWRQGDVLVMALESHTFGDNAVTGPALTLAFGEVTGHSHTMTAPAKKASITYEAVQAAIEAEHGEVPSQTQFKLKGIQGTPQYFQLKTGMDLVHDEHDATSLEAGYYKSTIQREYQAEKIQRVAD
jgi:hypothetical protein